MTTPVSALFTRAQIGDIELANRIVMAPMTRARAHGDDGVPTSIMQTYYEQRASAGLIVSEGVVISPDATGYVNVPGIYSPAQVAAWRPVTDKVHAKGGRIFAQIWHVGRISHPDLLGGRLPLAPSALDPHFQAFTRNGPADTVTPRPMTLDDIRQTIDDYAAAATNAVAAGFDGVEIHAANGYLVHQFLAPSANIRTDAYGGSHENRARFLFEVVDAVSRAIGRGRTAIRLNPALDGAAGIVLDDDLQKTFALVIERLDRLDLAYLHLAALTFDPKRDSPDRTIEIGKRYRPIFRGPLVINGALTRETAEDAVGQGVADFVAFGKPFIANPDLVRRLRDGIALAAPDAGTLYQGGAAGYIDYPTAAERDIALA